MIARFRVATKIKSDLRKIIRHLIQIISDLILIMSLEERFEARHFGAHDVLASLFSFEHEGAFLVGGGVTLTHGVGGKQLHFYRGERISRTFFDDGALHAKLERLRLCREAKEREQEGEEMFH